MSLTLRQVPAQITTIKQRFSLLNLINSRQYVYGKALEEILELKRFAKPMEVLVSSEVTTDIKNILDDCKDYTLVNTYCVELWVSIVSYQ